MPIYQVTKTTKEIVEAPGEDEAFGVFDHHAREFYAQESDAEEIKGLAHAERLGYDADVIPWGGEDNVTLSQIFKARDEEAWDKRVAVHVVGDDDVGESLKDLVVGFKKDVDVGDDVVGHVVWRLDDGTFRLESAKQREERLQSGLSDGEVAKDIIIADLKAQARSLARKVEALDG